MHVFELNVLQILEQQIVCIVRVDKRLYMVISNSNMITGTEVSIDIVEVIRW